MIVYSMQAPLDSAPQRQREARRRYERRHSQLRLRLKAWEKAALVRQAQELDVPAHTIALTAVRRACELPALLGPELDCAQEAARQLGAVGRNLNQITRKINAGEYAPPIEGELISELAEYAHAAAASVREMAEQSRLRWAGDAED